ncbi:MAG: class I SAM-dependent methyltransferase [Chloroflexi bacterium]|uniref:Class I SAM-dependent methyltransferase n=1 Tax=Candidatus Chlorohelix allophototropha TaxID=3003348 RepID=A0A8T7LZA7_9CHLR|nr:class I SAM-dependent methyltransferase [Chloroflexota bacterium]WJW65718.1 class I SAM-dependent methyltransferase [Chloroflexota bacterium L227-S17]
MFTKIEQTRWQGSQFSSPEQPTVEVSDSWLNSEGQQRARYRFARELMRGNDVLEIGCGSGHGSVTLLKSGARSVTSVDTSPDAIESARRHYAASNLHYQLADLQKLPYSKASFDVIVAFDIIEQVTDPEKLLKEFHRVLRSGGTLIISSHNRQYFSEGYDHSLYLRRGFTPAELIEILSHRFKPPYRIYGQFEIGQLTTSGVSSYIPTITEGLNTGDMKKCSKKSFRQGHAYLSEDDFVFSEQHLEEAPILLALCHK